jgi:hypothetical protein
VSAALYPAVDCDGPDCDNATHHVAARTVTDVRRLRKPDGWHARPGGRDICPGCWATGHR